MKKKRNLFGTLILSILLVFSGSAFAQKGERRQMRPNNPNMGMQQGQAKHTAMMDLSEEQKEKMNDLRTNHQKEMKYNQNLLNEKNARLKTLLSAPTYDEKAINSVIDEISIMKGDLLKDQIANRQEMKSILTPEQVQKFENAGHRMQERRGAGLKGRMDDRGTKNMRGHRGSFNQRDRNFHGRGLGLPNK